MTDASPRRPAVWVAFALFGSIFLLIAACASGAVLPLVASHPASPDGPETPWGEASQAASTQGVLGHDHQHGAAPAASSGVIYACPMHPEVTSGQPGVCPKCGMNLRPQP